MPERSASQQSQQQFWTPEQRTQILNYVNKHARDAIDEKDLDTDVEARGLVEINTKDGGATTISQQFWIAVHSYLIRARRD